jgi:hypothetical protein
MEIGVPDVKQGTLFVPIPIEVITYDSERLASNFNNNNNEKPLFQSLFPKKQFSTYAHQSRLVARRQVESKACGQAWHGLGEYKTDFGQYGDYVAHCR